MHLELLVEEPSMEAALDELLPRIVPGHSFKVHVHQGKSDLLRKVEQRLRAYARMAWFFGDVHAMREAYPKVPRTLASQAEFRDPDAITGGTWEALERVLARAGYYTTGMPKVEVARRISAYMDPQGNTSRSFQVLVEGLGRQVAT
ncbi:MAG: DUF4276 family protein [Solirubrobacteraceae bacterium]